MHVCIWPVEEGNLHNKQVQAVVLKSSTFKTNIDFFFFWECFSRIVFCVLRFPFSQTL